jgi:hypothetical protein
MDRLLVMFWVVMLCGLPSFQFWKQYVYLSPEDGNCMFLQNLLYLRTNSHGITTQKNNINVFTALRILHFELTSG